MTVLFVTYGLPYPPDSGARMRDFHLIREVSRGARVLVCSLATTTTEMNLISSLRPYCEVVEAHPGPRRSLTTHVADLVRGLRAGRPLAMHPFYFSGFAARIRELIVRHDVDLVQIEHSILAGYHDAVPAGHHCRTVLSFHNVASNQYQRMAHLGLPLKTRLTFVLKAWLMKRWEARFAGRFDHCVVVSPREQDRLHGENPALPLSIIENGVDTHHHERLEEAETGNILLFVGVMGYEPNADAARYFCNDVLPRVRREVPDARFVIVGHAPPREVVQLAAGENVIVTASVTDVTPYYQQARVTVVPLRGGGGTRLKILESMALGRPVVSTSIGCEGLDVLDGVHLMIADDPATFARHVVRLLQERALRNELASNARRLVEDRYEWSVLGQKLLAVHQGLSVK